MLEEQSDDEEGAGLSDGGAEGAEERAARLARFAAEDARCPVRDDGRTEEEREDLADDLLSQPAPWSLAADPPLALRYCLRHEAVAWCVHDRRGGRHSCPTAPDGAGRGRGGQRFLTRPARARGAPARCARQTAGHRAGLGGVPLGCAF